MPKKYTKNRFESKSGTFSQSKRPPKGQYEKADRSSNNFRGRRDKTSDHFTPSGRTTRDLPEKTDRSSDNFRGRRDGQVFHSFERPKIESVLLSDNTKPVFSEQLKTVSTTALKRGFERAKDEIVKICDEMSSFITSQYNIGKIELTISFNSNGDFIGFGTGGAASVKITIIPSK